MLNTQTQIETGNSVNFSGNYIKLEIDGEMFGLDIQAMNGVVGDREMTPIPNAPSYVKGVCNLMGERLPVVDMRLMLNREVNENDRAHVIIARGMSRGQYMKVGLMVDKVTQVESTQPEFLSAAPSYGTDESSEYVAGTIPGAEASISLLDVESILSRVNI